MMDTQALKNDVRKKIFEKRKLAHNARNTSETLFLSPVIASNKCLQDTLTANMDQIV